MRICTSLGPRRTERQQHCIRSWLDLGCEVVAVQPVGEIERLRPLYPDVTFVETTKVGDVFMHQNLVRINALLDQAHTEPIMIVNSDIEIRSTKEEFYKNWHTTEDKKLLMGIRWDEDPVTREQKILKYGIDAFLITPAIAKDLNDIGMTMGCPAWDYWIPIHLQRKGYGFVTSKRVEMIHEVHEQNWSRIDFKIGVSLLYKYYNLELKAASKFILQITERLDLP